MALVGASALSATPGAAQWSGHTAVESRLFPSGPLDPRQRHHAAALALQPALRLRWDAGRQFLTFEPFVRLDAADGDRTHADVREFTWQRVWDTWELTVGVGKVYWGVTESQHLVDIVNQTDLVEDVDGEDKLGQPMIRLTTIRPWGTVDAYVLPLFRPRTFPGRRGRLRLPVSDDHVQYESDARWKHVDWAIRWFHSLGTWDIGLSYFGGTSRDPRFIGGTDGVLTPRYDQIHQTGLDVQRTTGGWLWKLEAINRWGQGDRYAAVTAGFEYTLVGVVGTTADLGLLVEYLWDERGRAAPNPFADDAFVGGRLALNDVQSTDLLAGAIIDRRTGTALFSLEGSRRMGSRWKLRVETRTFANVDAADPLYGLRRDHYAQFTVERHF